MRLEVLQDLVRKSGLDAYLITRPSSIYYFTRVLTFEGKLALVVPSKGEASLLVRSLEFELAKVQSEGCQLIKVQLGRNFVEEISKLLSRFKKVGFDQLRAGTYLSLSGTGVHLEERPQLVWNLRRAKSEEELACMREAIRIATEGLRKASEAIEAGVRECDVAAEAEAVMRRLGSQAHSFETIVASGPHAAYPHAICSMRELRPGDLVIVDVGATYQGYRSDITRTFVVKEPTEKQVELLDAVTRAQREAIRAARCGVKASDLDKVARSRLAQLGFDEYFVHGLGHGIGLDVHEPPRLSPESRDVLRNGDVVTIEPAIYVPGYGGVRIEDMVLITKERAEVLTQFSDRSA